MHDSDPQRTEGPESTASNGVGDGGPADLSVAPASLPEAHSLCLEKLNVVAGDRCLLRDVDAVFPAAKITVIVGGSGAGKSVLLRLLAGLIPQNGDSIGWSGEIKLGGKSSGDKPADDSVTPVKPSVGIVFQQFALFDELTARENVQFAIDHRHRIGSGKVQSGRKPSWTAKQWLEHLGVPQRTSVTHLSGGQKQRLAIARTLAASPEVVLYDEPTSGLDAASGRLVAQLIRETQEEHHRTSVVVTHDYETLIPIADKVYLLDPQAERLVEIEKQRWAEIPQLMVPAQDSDGSAGAAVQPSWVERAVAPMLEATGGAIVAALRLPLDLVPIVPRHRWAARFTLHYARLVAGFSAWVYLMIAGLIIGFTATYFTFRFLPFRVYTQPLLIDELLASIGFALYRVLVPILATILVAARCGAAVAADVGVKQYGGQVDAMKTLGVSPRSYLLLPIVVAFVIGTPILEWLAFQCARSVSMVSFAMSFPDIGPHFWQLHFDRNLMTDGTWFSIGWKWVLLKNVVCGLGTATIAYYQGLAPKRSAGDVSRSITSTVLWTTLFVLVVHLVVALSEF
ncbi:ABC transporter permease [Roseiconus lacunae]|uniref:ABC transporter permease n=1 Tax=Roseiconus lacunae TaxID=2605694 RepID=A0ABT7PN39_9BACT|nr:ABC transporter permease [Roseiconus lacunae]MDM4017901.1 ABC transporter permease [Roseiconus lacunae]